MKTSLYSTAWQICKMDFDFKSALDNWATFADEISIAVNTSTDGTYDALASYAAEQNYPVRLVQTTYDFGKDPYAYGKTVNAALQNCTGDLMILQDMDERFLVGRDKLQEMHRILRSRFDIQAFFIPTIDLYGSYERAAKIGEKWYGHGPSLYRGPVNFGIKSNGYIDYNKSSSDELVSITGELIPTLKLLNKELTIENLRAYVAEGWPISFHLGYFDLKNRSQRAEWWGKFWKMATNGDPNGHITDVAELEKRHTFEHGLPLWKTTKDSR